MQKGPSTQDVASKSRLPTPEKGEASDWAADLLSAAMPQKGVSFHACLKQRDGLCIALK